jgi:hypothetical protein
MHTQCLVVQARVSSPKGDYQDSVLPDSAKPPRTIRMECNQQADRKRGTEKSKKRRQGA